MLVVHTPIPTDTKLISPSIHVSTTMSPQNSLILVNGVMVLLNTKHQVVMFMLKKAITGILRLLLHAKH